jgi:hypothetical protein
VIIRNLSFGSADRDVAIVSGEMYPDSGILIRLRYVRSLVDERSCGNDGNEIRERVRRRRLGADPFKSLSRRTSSSSESIERDLNAGNDSSIAVTIRSHR